MEFKELLSNARKEKKISLRKLEKISGVPETTISNYEHGVQPTLTKADALLKALGVSIVIGSADKLKSGGKKHG